MSRKETGFGFSFKNHLKDTAALSKHFVDKIDKIEERFKLRKGPELYWLRENEDDSKLVVPDDKFKSGIPTISRLLYDFESGIAAVGAQPNAGKSSLLVACCTSILELQEDTVVIDLTLDDSISKRYVQLICSMTGLPYQWIYNIENVPDAARDAYEFGKKKLKNWIEEGRYFPFEGTESFNLDSKNIDVLINSEAIFHDMLESFREYAGDRKVVFFADAFNDMSFDRDRIAKLDDSVKNLKHTANANLVKMFMTTHIRKMEKRNQDPTLDDFKGSKELEFSAAYAGLLRNDKKENPDDYLTIERDGIELPVITLESPKNKVSAWDQNWYAGMRPETCQIFPVTKQEYLTLNERYLNRRKEKK